MSAGRTTMMAGGSGLIALGSLALLARYLQMGGVSALALDQPVGLYHTLTVGTILSGLILVIFAPPTRRTEHRVRLDMPDRETGGTRPRERASTTTTSTPRTAAVATAPPPQPAPTMPRSPTATSGPDTYRAPQASPVVVASHPNDPGDDEEELVREQLASRLDELNRRANEMKVRYGLGKVSPGGYRKFIEELDVERSKIEARLMEPER